MNGKTTSSKKENVIFLFYCQLSKNKQNLFKKFQKFKKSFFLLSKSKLFKKLKIFKKMPLKNWE